MPLEKPILYLHVIEKVFWSHFNLGQGPSLHMLSEYMRNFHFFFFINFVQGISGISPIPNGYNPATWMLEVTTAAVEAKIDSDFAEIYRNSGQYR